MALQGFSFDGEKLLPQSSTRGAPFLPLSLIIDGFFFSSHKPRVDIPRPSAFRNIAGYIAEGAGLIAGRTVFWRGFSLKGIIAM
jgi:hypothetical protein